MYNAWYSLIGYMFIAYIIICVAAALFLLGYTIYKIINKVKTRYPLRKSEPNDII